MWQSDATRRGSAMDRCDPRLNEARRAERDRMVERQLVARGIGDPRLLDAFRHVPREAFVAPPQRHLAYDDGPLPIAAGQTISQPFIVAEMIAAADLSPASRVLEIGCGSGYAAAVMSRIAARVFTIDRHAELVEAAAERFVRLGYPNIETRVGDGTLGWPEAAPFEAILVAAAGPDVPPALLDQLTVDGRLVMPVGDLDDLQRLVRIVRDPPGTYESQDLGPVRFVPLVGAQGWKR